LSFPSTFELLIKGTTCYKNSSKPELMPSNRESTLIPSSKPRKGLSGGSEVVAKSASNCGQSSESTLAGGLAGGT